MNMTKIYTLLDKCYATRAEAETAQAALLEAGYVLGDEFIQEWSREQAFGSDDHKWHGIEMLAEQRNALIDFSGSES